MTGAALRREDVLAIHAAATDRFGGADGVRDEGLLDSALAQPFQAFAGRELYATTVEKAARYAFGIISDHPFVDGNKRTATAVMGAYLRLSGCAFEPRHDELLSIMMGAAAGEVSYEELVRWVAENV